MDKKTALFFDLLLASIKDAVNGHLSQMQIEIMDTKGAIRQVRVVVLPEQMSMGFPDQSLKKKEKDAH